MLIQLIVDGEPFGVRIKKSKVTVASGNLSDSEAMIRTGYESMMAVADGTMSPKTFLDDHLILSGDPAKGRLFLELLQQAMHVLTA
jgi:hypothetical protein